MSLFIVILPVFLLLIMGALLQRWRFPFEGAEPNRCCRTLGPQALLWGHQKNHCLPWSM